MKQMIGLWCIYCENMGQSHTDNGRRCIQCLRDTITEGLNEIDEPLHYKEGV